MIKSQLTLKYVGDLRDLRIPKFQRIVDKEHVAHLVRDQKKEYEKWKCFSILQSISIATVRGDDSYVIDGQHRLLAFKELEQQGYPVRDIVIPVVIYDILDMTEMKHYFTRINMNRQVHPLELQEDFANVGKVLVENFTKEFGIYVKNDTKNSRCPHINLSELKKHIAARNIGDILEQHSLSVRALWEKIEEFNSYIANNVKSHQQLCQMMGKRIAECELKAIKFSAPTICYLGIWRKFEWLDFCLLALVENKQFADINISCETTPKRLIIPVSVREQVWKKVNVNTSDIGVCFTCCNDLYFRDMECGHIKAHSLGGKPTFDNLMPVCKSCNKDMGIMDLFLYKSMIEAMSN